MILNVYEQIHKIGLQEVHADVQKHQYAASCYVVIFYLVETESTAVADVLTGELDSMWKGTIPQNVERLKSVNFRTERVFVGDALVMTGATFHYGIANPDLYQRFVGFLSFTPKSLPPMDSQQQFYPIGIRDY
jgi:ABC-type transport system substrate-binding protein